MTNASIRRRFRLSPATITACRRKLGIPVPVEALWRCVWTPAMIKNLGRITDDAFHTNYHVAVTAVAAERRRRGIPRARAP